MPHFITTDLLEKDQSHALAPHPESTAGGDMNRLVPGPSLAGSSELWPATMARKVNPRFASRLKSRLSRL